MNSKKVPNLYAVLGGGDEIFSNDCHTEWLRVSLSEMPDCFKKGKKTESCHTTWKNIGSLRLNRVQKHYQWLSRVMDYQGQSKMLKIAKYKK